jgi:CRISPR-associated endonuclease Cas2
MSVGLYWVVYDISDDRERYRVERCLARYGQRLQKSVFRCILNNARRKRMLLELDQLAIQSGQVICAPVQEALASAIGAPMPPLESWAFAI